MERADAIPPRSRRARRGAGARATVLELQLAHGAPRAVGPLDVLREARRRFLQGKRLDMRALASDLGVSRATLYRWVGDRERLLGEILWSLGERALAEARAHADAYAADGGVDWVVRFYYRFMEMTADFEPIRRFVAAEADTALRVLTSRHGVQQRRLIDALRTVLEERAAAGDLALPLDARDLAYVMVRIGESFIWREFITGEEPDLSKAADVVRILLSRHGPAPRKVRSRRTPSGSFWSSTS
ncbi:MAG TPA: QsdR family transcriptional regulator [Candidatus Dormibacteraeota bacterium]|nr:QsdR family transcriptional regulator [Candidatus Dormibacteraeota bacterium]